MTAQAAQSIFGCGYLWITGADGTPRLGAALQSVSFDESVDSKPLYGSSRYALEIGDGKGKLDFKAEVGRFDPNVLNQLLGGTITTGMNSAANLEAHSIPATPYQVTVSNSATWTSDLGVYNTVTGKFMTKVASSPAAGQYSVAAGVYTFAAADTGAAVKISYCYSLTGGYNIAYGNPQMGSRPTFRVDMFNSYNGVPYGITAVRCKQTKASFAGKQDDWTYPNFEFSAMDDGSGNTITQYGQGQY